MRVKNTKVISRLAVLCFSVFGLSLPLLSQGSETTSSQTVLSKSSALHDSNTVGNLAGSFSVDQEGNANYDIPLSASPGTAGMTPQLSIHYDSSGGNGLMGMGFSLQGLTAITRAPQNYAQNGQVHGVDFSNNDRFALNGQQLVAVSGSYGSDGAEYRTYIDSQSRIVSQGNQGNGPQSFIVVTKGGQTAFYGGTTDSQVVVNDSSNASKTVVSWLLTKIIDQSGNEIDYHYNQEVANGTNYPSEIDYTGNPKTGLVSYASIKFVYEQRPDPILSYQASTKFYVSQRLKEIQAYYKNDLVYDYKINYELAANTNKSRVTSISQCDSSGQCLRPLIFHWQTNDAGWTENDSYAPQVPIVCDVGHGLQDCGVRFADLQGNGKIWMLQAVDNSGHQKGSWVFSNGWQGDSRYALPDSFSFARVGQHQEERNNYNFLGDAGTRLQDVTGNGLPDVIQAVSWFFSDPIQRNALRNTGNGWTTDLNLALPQGWVFTAEEGSDMGVRFANLRGNGLIDAIQGDGQSGRHRAVLNTGNGWTPDSGKFTPPDSFTNVPEGGDFGLRLIDLTGSGLDDALLGTKWNQQEQTRDAWLNPLKTGADTWAHSGSSAFSPPIDFSVDQGKETGIQVADVLGDGLPILMANSHVNLWNGHGSVDYQGAWIDTGKGWLPDNTYQPSQQLNDDGKDAGVVFEDVTGSGQPMMLQNTGLNGNKSGAWRYDLLQKQWIRDDSYTPKVEITDGNGRDNGARFVDLLGTGFPDLIISTPNQHQAFLNNAQTKPDIITNIQDALGDTLKIQYKPITDSSIYTKGQNAVYPNMDIQAPIYVVAKTFSDTAITPLPAISTVANKLAKLVNDTVTQHITDYSYANAVVNHLGWGFLGFGSMTTKDETTGISLTTTYSQDTDHHTQGMPIGSITQLSDGTILNKQSAVFDTKVFGSGQCNQTIYLPYVKTSTEDSYDLNGAHLSTKTTTTTLDNFSNPTDILQTAIDNTGRYTTDTANQYINDTSNGHWWIGQLMVANVTASAPNTPSMTRATSYTYDPVTGMLQSTTTYTSTPATLRGKPGVKFYDDNRFLTKTYKRDAYGNITETDTTGSDIAPRSESVIYDDQNYYRFVKTKINPLGQQSNFTYDVDFGSVKTATDPNQLTITNFYDSFGRMQSTTHPDGTISRISYQWTANDIAAPPGTVYEVISTETGGATKISYHDELDREIAQAAQGFGGKWIWQLTYYDERGLMVGKTTPFYVGDTPYVTSNEYDVLGRVTLTKYPGVDHSMTHMQYNGYSTTTINPKDQHTTKTVNIRGNLIASENVLGMATYQYDAFGNLTMVTDTQGHTINNQYDNWGHKLQTNDPDAGKWSYTYDVLGEMLTQTDPLGNQTISHYDLLGRMVSRTDSGGTSTWHYDGAANGIGKLDSENGVSNIINQPMGKTKGGVQIVRQTIGKPTSVQVLKAAEDHLVSYNRSYTYDTLSRPEKLITNLNGQTYTQQTNYDADGRVDVVTDPDGVKTKNHYDDAGYLTSVSDPDSAVVYSTVNAMNAQGQVTSVTRSNGLITTYTYDPQTTLLSNILTQATPALAIQENLFPTSNKNDASQWHLQLAGGKESKQSAAAMKMLSPLSSLRDGSAVQQLDYYYDELGNVSGRIDKVLNTEDHFGYDPINRLAAVQLIDNTHNKVTVGIYKYDDLGNIINKPGVGHYTYDPTNLPHAVRSIAPIKPTDQTETDSFLYDAAGEQTHADMQTANGHIIRDMTYTSFEVPKTITQTNDKTNANAQVNFYYDANHNRFMREDVISVNGQNSKATTLYLGNEEVDTTTDSNGTHTTTKNFIGDTLIVNNDDGTHHRYEILKDAIGSTNVIVDEQGNVAQRFHYDPFGEQELVSDSQAKKPAPSSRLRNGNDERTSISLYGFTGQEEVEAGGIDLVHMNGRMYDPHLGRFLSPDPVIQDPSNIQCLNRYSYCQNNPEDYIDPTGFSFWSSLWKGAKHLFHDVGHAIDNVLRNPVVGALITITASAIAVWATGGLAGIGLAHAAVSAWGAAAWYAGAAAVSGVVSYAQTGNIGSALLTAGESFASMYAWNGIGHLDGKLFGSAPGAWFGESWMHGVAGGGMAAIEGGSFKDGFIASAAAQAASSPIGEIGKISALDTGVTVATIAARGVAAAVVGGTVAAAIGGNIENGAMTSAYAEMFNDAAHEVAMKNQLSAIQHELTTNVQKGISDLHAFVNQFGGSVTVEFTAGEGGGVHTSLTGTNEGVHFFIGGGAADGVSYSTSTELSAGADPEGPTAIAGVSGGIKGTPLGVNGSVSLGTSGISDTVSIQAPVEGASAYLVVGYTTKVYSWDSISRNAAGVTGIIQKFK